jgi:hypothetical protein
VDVITGGPDGGEAAEVPVRSRIQLRAWAADARARWPRAYRAGVAVLAAVALGGAVAFLRAGATGLEDPPPPEPAQPSAEGAPYALLADDGHLLVRLGQPAGPEAAAVLPRDVEGDPVVADASWLTPSHTVLVTRAGGGRLAAAVLDPRGTVLRRLPEAAQVLAAPGGQSAWLVRAEGSTGQTVQRYGLDGRPRSGPSPVPARQQVAAALAASLVLSSAGDRALSLWNPGRGAPQPLGVRGRVVSAAQDVLLADCGAGCGYVAMRAGGAAPARLGLPAGHRALGDPVLSPDGGWVAVNLAPVGENPYQESVLAYAAVQGADPLPPLRTVPGSEVRDRYGPQPGQQGRAVRPAWSGDGWVYGFLPGHAGLYRYRPGAAAIEPIGASVPGVILRISAG